MNSKRNLIIGIAALVVAVAAAVVAYQLLSGNAELAPPHAPGQTQPQQQSPAVDFTVEGYDGSTVSFSSIEGPAVLNFWTTWCPSCTRMMPDLEALYQEFGEEVTFMMINLVGSRGETPLRSMAYIEDRGYTFPVYFDTEREAARAFGVHGIPHTVFIDQNGNTTEVVGQRPQVHLRQYIERIIDSPTNG